MFASFWIKINLALFTASLRCLFPGIWSFWGLAFVQNKLTSVFLWLCPLIDDKYRHNTVKGYCGTTRLRLVVPRPLWQCYDAIYHQQEDRPIKNWRQFVNLCALLKILINNWEATNALHPGGYLTKFDTGGSTPRSNHPLIYTILAEKVPLLYTFYWKRCPFHIPTLRSVVLIFI